MPISKLEESFNNFRYVKNKSRNFFKGCNYSNQILFLSNALKNDYKSSNKKDRRWHTYQRGTLIKVNFGLNIGTELSGPHYAISITKNDNPLSEKITVIPLTSKTGTHNHALDFSISKQIAGFLALKGYEIASKEDDPLEMAMLFLAMSYDKTKEIEKEFLTKLENEKEIREGIKKQLNIYMNSLEKKSFVKLDNVTTISKHRILLPEHAYDPLGKMIITDTYMNKIDEAIVSYIIDN
ncbi:hypothetical protein [uncultured Vagococcus sp.]|uniref:hypothetical protein n=1 Tax=uncultured Vagococcus sp. TaxID=189676 RepID=UPI0028D62F09|nr:hypothetical protein [uncultured Vagococcus sp.]